MTIEVSTDVSLIRTAATSLLGLAKGDTLEELNAHTKRHATASNLIYCLGGAINVNNTEGIARLALSTVNVLRQIFHNCGANDENVRKGVEIFSQTFKQISEDVAAAQYVEFDYGKEAKH